MSLAEAITYAPLATPVVAIAASIVAGVIAVYSIAAQRRIARRRAALDIFFKTELDKSLIDAYDAYHDSVKMLSGLPPMSYDQLKLEHSDHFRNVRAYLSIHELIAVGIKTKVLDEGVCYEFWGSELINGDKECKQVIKACQATNPFMYCELEYFADRWRQQKADELVQLRKRNVLPAPIGA